mgnify:CR=1 FL=1
MPGKHDSLGLRLSTSLPILALALALALPLAACGKGSGSCTVGSEGCDCTPGGGCDPGLDCLSGTCVNPNPDTHTDAPSDTTPADTTPDAAADAPDAEAGCATSADCDDLDPCTTDTCDTDYGTCSHYPVDADLDGYPAASVSGTACGGTDCDDARDDVYPGAAESSCWDHLDQACDGARGPVVLTPPVSLALAAQNWMDVAWTGSEFLVATAEYGYSMNLTRIGLDGARVASDVGIGDGLCPAIAWSGSAIGVSYVTPSATIASRVFDPEGSPLGSEVGLPGDLNACCRISASRIVWTGSEFGIAWRDDASIPPLVRFGRMDASGSPTGTDTSMSSSGANTLVMDLAWTGSEFLVGRTIDMNTYALQRLDAVGNPIGDPLARTPRSDSNDARYGDRLAWSGSVVGLTEAWTLGIFDPLLSPVASTESLGAGPMYPTVSWGASQFGLAWYSGSDPGMGIYFALVDQSGTILGDGIGQIELTDADAGSDTAWTGSEFGLIWSNGVSMSVGFATVGWCD